MGRYDATRLRVKFTISRAPVGSAWQLFGSDDGHRIFAVTRLADINGVVRVGRVIADRAGPDVIKASGYALLSGQTCSGSATF